MKFKISENHNEIQAKLRVEEDGILYLSLNDKDIVWVTPKGNIHFGGVYTNVNQYLEKDGYYNTMVTIGEE